ncbi:hypothetical protein [Roseibium sp.]|uniref:hypothetical protein n=1 Tax=Roseibium sp. TaxID=1936156 RepID=UPI003B507A2F
MEEFLYVFFGALFGSTLTFIASIYLSVRTHQVSHITDYLNDVQLLETAAVDYWTNSSFEDWNAQQERSAIIKGRLSSVSIFIDKAENLLSSRHEAISRLDEELFYATTDGAFDTREQIPEYDRVAKIMSVCSQLRYELRDYRWRLFWAH